MQVNKESKTVLLTYAEFFKLFSLGAIFMFTALLLGGCLMGY